MFDSTVTITRAQGDGTTRTVATGVRVQVDQVSLVEAAQLRMAYTPNVEDYFKVFTTDWYANALIQRDDLLSDERVTDPETGQRYVYRVVGRPKTYEWSHQECYCRVIVGS